MAQKTLTTSYLAQLSNANHDGVSQQICDRLTGFTTDNQMLTTATQGVVAARQAEDTAFKRYSGKGSSSGGDTPTPSPTPSGGDDDGGGQN